MNLDSRLYMYKKETLEREDIDSLERASMKIRSDIMELISAAGSGHIGGAYSTADALLLTYLCANISPENTEAGGRDRIVVSHGHISAGLYTILADLGYIDKNELFREYRRIPGKYEGHPSRLARGVEWGNGSLGQGLSQACGMALSNRMDKEEGRVFVFMGDGEQEKGQITEAMALASKYRLNRLIAFVDQNDLQCTGKTAEVLPMELPARYRAYGWNVLETDGHDYGELYRAYREAYYSGDGPTVIIGKTVMGKGIPFIENNKKYHGGFLNGEQLAEARKIFAVYGEEDLPVIEKNCGEPGKARSQKEGRRFVKTFYSEAVACRSAAGEAILEIGNAAEPKDRPVVIDCDVAPSTGMEKYVQQYPQQVIQCGIAESNAMSAAGGMAVCGKKVFFSTFAMFAFGEVYGQLRANMMNHAPVKVIATHCGLDVGPDGKTHQCIDYIGLAANLYGFELIVPADGNQTAHAVEYLYRSEQAGGLALGRSSLPILKKDGAACYGADYSFVYGKADWIDTGEEVSIISMGTLVHTAAAAVEQLKAEGISCGLLNVSCPLELDQEKIREAARAKLVIVFEDHNVNSGLGIRVSSFLQQERAECKVILMGLREFGGSSDAAELYRRYGLDTDTLVKTIKKNYR